MDAIYSMPIVTREPVVCPDCDADETVFRYDGTGCTCTGCGLVIDENAISDKFEHNKDAMGSYNAVTSHKTTMPPEMPNFASKMMQSTECANDARNHKTIVEYLERMHIGETSNIFHTTIATFKAVSDAKKFRMSATMDEVIVSCMYIAFQSHGGNAGRGITEMCATFALLPHELKPMLCAIQRHLLIKAATQEAIVPAHRAAITPPAPPTPMTYAVRMIQKLHTVCNIKIELDKDVYRVYNRAVLINDIRRKNDIMNGSSVPDQIAAVVVYFACAMENIFFPLQYMTKVIGVTMATLKKYAVRLAPFVSGDIAWDVVFKSASMPRPNTIPDYNAQAVKAVAKAKALAETKAAKRAEANLKVKKVLTKV